MRRQAIWMSLGILLALLLVACSSKDLATFRHEKFGFTVRYPAHWRVNEVRVVPPAPIGTSLSSEKVTVTIMPWELPVGDPSVLREQGWAESAVTIGSLQGVAFSRPAGQSGDGILKRVFIQTESLQYDFTLIVDGEPDHRAAVSTFDAIIQSLTLTP